MTALTPPPSARANTGGRHDVIRPALAIPTQAVGALSAHRIIKTAADAREALKSIRVRDVPALRVIGRANTISMQLGQIAARTVGTIPNNMEI